MEDLTLKEAKHLMRVGDAEDDQFIYEMIPVVIEFVRVYCENPAMRIEGGAKIAVVKIIEFFMNDSGLKSRSIARINESYLTEIPESILTLLKPYNKRNMVKFL